MKKQEQVREYDQSAIADLGKVTEETQGVFLETKREGASTIDYYTP